MSRRASLLGELRNIGPASARWLRAVGVTSRADLEAIGPVEAFQRIRDAGFGPTLNLLWALQGAVLDVHWAELPPELKTKLKAAVEGDAESGS